VQEHKKLNRKQADELGSLSPLVALAILVASFFQWYDRDGEYCISLDAMQVRILATSCQIAQNASEFRPKEK